MKALVIGATGAVGKDLVEQLLADGVFGRVDVFVRREVEASSAKLVQHVVVFDHPEVWSGLLTGDVLFSCLGTTIRAAGSQQAQWKVDYTYQYEAAKAARANGVPKYILVSALGASSGSKIFYSRMKGALEDAVKELGFPGCFILQPPSLIRKGSDRFGEKAGVIVLKGLNGIGLMRSWKPIPTEEVAAAMVRASKRDLSGNVTITAQDILLTKMDKDLVKLIIFDFDGTLGDTTANIVRTMQDTMRAEGLPEASEADIVSTIGVPLEKGFEMLYPEQGEDIIRKLTATYRTIFERNRKMLVPALFTGVEDTLTSLKRKGFLLTVASSRSSASLKGFLRDMDIDKHISYVLGADSVERAKPDPEPVLKTMRELGFSPEETLVVGDMPVDVEMGKRARTRTVAVTYGNSCRSDLERAGADFIIDGISELEAIVERMNIERIDS